MAEENTTTRPAFTKVAAGEETPVRDKDNADRVFAPRFAPGGDNRAPRGSVGTKRDLPTPEREKAASPQSLKKTFQPLVKGNDKDRRIER